MDIDVTSEAVRVTAIVAALTPLLIAVFTQFHWSSQVKQIISVIVAGAVGVVVAMTSDVPVTWQNAGSLALLAIGASQLAYSLLWKPTSVAPKIEAATSTAPPAVMVPDYLVVPAVSPDDPAGVPLPEEPEPVTDEQLAAANLGPLAAPAHAAEDDA